MPSVNAIRRTRASKAVLGLAVGLLGVFLSEDLQAQQWPYRGVMPNVGAMAYDLRLTQTWSPQGIRMTGFASSAGGHVRWVHCVQPSMLPFRQCRLMVDGVVSNGFALPPRIDLGRWLVSRFRRLFGENFYPDDFSGSTEISGQWRWGVWMASGRFRYWR